MTEKRRFAIHPSDQKKLASVPWDFIAPHFRRAESNHAQSLERLNERGGLGLEELWCVLNDKGLRYCRSITNDQALTEIKRRLAEWEKERKG
jgi:hypothetical protein